MQLSDIGRSDVVAPTVSAQPPWMRIPPSTALLHPLAAPLINLRTAGKSSVVNYQIGGTTAPSACTLIQVCMRLPSASSARSYSGLLSDRFTRRPAHCMASALLSPTHQHHHLAAGTRVRRHSTQATRAFSAPTAVLPCGQDF